MLIVISVLFGGLFVLVAVGILAFVLYNRKKKEKEEEEEEKEKEEKKEEEKKKDDDEKLIDNIPYDAGAGDGQRIIVYLSNWGQYFGQSTCGKQASCKRLPENFPVDLATHILYAFSFIDPKTFHIKFIEQNDKTLIQNLMSKKTQNPNVRILLALGGWTMNVPKFEFKNAFGDTGDVNPFLDTFSNMVETPQSRKAFIESAFQVCVDHGFDGIDIDWEYPGDASRGGKSADKENLVSLFKEFRTAAPKGFLLSLAVPGGSSKMGGLDMKNIHPHVDFITVMTYDALGDWSSSDIGMHTNWPFVNAALTAYINQGVPAGKLSMGLAAYGRGWSVSGGTYSRGKTWGCSCEHGYHSWKDLVGIMNEATVKQSTQDVAAHMTYDGQYIGFDTLETLGQKITKAKDMNLGGVTVWAGDLDDDQYTFMKKVNEMWKK